MAEPFIGEIKLIPFNFAPRGWAVCAGQLLPIAGNDALFSLIGTTYGGDGQVTFGLPNLQGRRAYGQGQGPGLANMVIGQELGTELVSLNTQQMPTHTHPVTAVRGGALTAPSTNPTGAAWSNEVKGSPQNIPYAVDLPVGAMSGAAISVAGSSIPHDNLPPFLALNYIIAIEGIYPARN